MSLAVGSVVVGSVAGAQCTMIAMMKCWQDIDCTVPADKNGDPVAVMVIDKVLPETQRHLLSNWFMDARPDLPAFPPPKGLRNPRSKRL